MKFDNSSFAKGVESTLAMLSKLTAGIAGVGGSKGLGDLNASAKGVDLSPVATQVEGISAKFLALSTVAITALSNITNRAVDAGLGLAKSFAIDPILDGFAEYELKMGSIQTILANTDRYGTSLSEVTGALDELNEYADKTIYNFGDMTKNIGLFTNSGMRIEEATSVIKGFSNSAAASGTSAQGAASAAYQLSQAFSTGTIRLMDWRSLTNVGLGNKNMQLGIIEIADAMGELDKAGISSQQVQADFNGSLEKNWLSADVMSNYLTIMAGDMDKAKMASLGLTEAQIDGFARQQKIAEDAATKVRTFTQLMSTLKEAVASGWSETFNTVFGDFNQATKLFTSISENVGGIFDGMSDARNELLTGWADLGGRKALIEGLANVFKALANVIKPIRNAFRDIFPPTTSAQLYRLTDAFREWTEGLIASGPTMKNIRTIFGAIFGVLGVGIDVIQGVVKYFATFIGLLTGGTGGVLDLVASVADIVFQFTQWVKQGNFIGRFFDTVIAGRAAVFGPIIEALSGLLSLLAGIISSGADVAIAGIVKAAEFLGPIIGYAADKVAYFIELLTGKLGEGVNKIRESKDFFVELGEVIQGKVVAAFEKALPVLIEIRDFFVEIGGVVQDKVVAAFDKILPVLSEVKAGIEDAFGSISDIGGKVSGAVGGATSGLSGLFDMGNAAEETEGTVSRVKSALASVAPTGNELSSGWGKFVSFLKGAGAVIAAIGVGIYKGLEFVWGKVTDGFSALGGSVGGIYSTIKGWFSKIGDLFSSAGKDLNLEDVLALINTGFFIALYVTFQRFLSKFGKLADSLRDVFDGAGDVLGQVTKNLKTMQTDVRANILLKIAGAVAILAAALFILSSIPADQLKQGLASVAGLIAMLVAAMLVLEKTSGKTITGAASMVLLSASMTIMAVGLTALAGAVLLFGKMDTDELKQGFIAIGIALGVMVAAAALLSATGGSVGLLVAAAAILVLSISLTALAGAIKLYSAIDTETLVSGGLKIAAIIVGLGLAMMAMTGSLAGAAAMFVVAAALTAMLPVLFALGSMELETLGKALLGLAGVFVVLGLGGLLLAPVAPVLLAVGAAIFLLGAGAALAGAGLVAFAAGITALAAAGAVGVGILTAYVIGIAELFPLIMQQIGLGIRALAKVIAKSGPQFVAAMTTLIISLAKAVQKAAPHVGKALSALIREGLRVLFTYYGDFIAAGVQFILRLIRGIENNVDKMAKAARKAAVAFINAVAKEGPKLVDAGFKALIKFIDGISNAIDSNAGMLRSAGLRLAASIVDGLTGGLLGRGLDLVRSAASRLAEAIPGPVRSILGINSPAKAMIPLGEGVGEGLVYGMNAYGKKVGASAEGLGKAALDTLSATMSGVSKAVGDNVEMNPTITPVLDLTNLEQNASRIGGMLSSNPITTSVSYASAADIANSTEAERAFLAERLDRPTTEIKFEQTNTSPQPLSEVEVYRNTRNLLSLAKEALNA